MRKETAVRSAHVLFKGMVQGVGFRFIARAQAQDLKVKGWIKNLPNGDVELMVEQTKEVLEELLFRLNRYFSKYPGPWPRSPQQRSNQETVSRQH